MAYRIYASLKTSGSVKIDDTTASSSVSTGALVVGGGIGADGKVTAKSATLTDTTTSSSLTTGALIVGGGIGVGGQVSAQIFKAFGSGYELTTSLDGTGVKFSVNSSIRNIEFQTGATTRMTIDGGGAVSVANVLTTAAGTATPAGGSTAARLLFGTTAGFGIYYGSGVPTVSAAQGSLYIRSDGSSTSTRLYVNTNGTTGWTNFTSAT